MVEAANAAWTSVIAKEEPSVRENKTYEVSHANINYIIQSKAKPWLIIFKKEV